MIHSCLFVYSPPEASHSVPLCVLAIFDSSFLFFPSLFPSQKQMFLLIKPNFLKFNMVVVPGVSDVQ